MRILLIHCHPVPDSYGAALRDVVRAALQRAGHTVELRDLYAEDFRPAMNAEERLRHMVVPDNIIGVEDHAASLRAADALVLVYPSWWFGMPAMLKGWFDRVWRVGVAWEVGPGVIRPALTNITRIAVVTTYGSPAWLLWYVGWPDHRLIARGVRRLCARRCRLDWLWLPGMDRQERPGLERFLRRVEAHFARW